MPRPTLRSMRDNIDASTINKTGLANDQRIKRRILEREVAHTDNTAITSVLDRQSKMKVHQKTSKRFSTNSSPRCQNNNKPIRKDFNSPEGFNECGLATGRSYASRAAERMESKQEGFPDVMRHPTTINSIVLPLDAADVKVQLDTVRSKMRKAFEPLSDGVQIVGGFHVAMQTAKHLATIFPTSELPECLDPIDRPNDIYALLHWHGIIADPYLTKSEVRDIIKEAYPSSKRVCVAKVQPEQINKHGQTTHGAQGYLEYACMEKTEVKFTESKQKIDAIKGYAQIGAQLNKRNRQFSMGKPIAVTNVDIDPMRVMKLQVMERLNYVRKNFKDLSYAEQFIHLWMSGAFSIINKSQSWLQHNNTTLIRFIQFFSIVKKWSMDDAAETPCFYGCSEVLLE